MTFGTLSRLWHEPTVIETEVLFRLADAAQDAGDHELARQSFERGAALGDTASLTRLALIYDVGVGVAPDRVRAMSLYQRAWRLGRDAVAANNIAILYKEGGRRREMFRWFQRSAGTGDGSAHLSMAKCYLDGSGVRSNPQSALRCLAVAAGSFYISGDEREEAQALLKTLAPNVV